MQRILRIYLTFFILFLSSGAFAQLISFSVKNESLEKVFQIIEAQSGYSFIYSNEQLLKAKPVTLQVSNEELTAVVSKCFANQPLLYKVDNKHIIVREKPADPIFKNLRGRLLTETGEPIVGATISMRNSTAVSISDNNGYFIINDVNPASILVFSGAEIDPQEKIVGNQDFLVVHLATKINVLDEAIIIAYGKTSRRRGTGSVSKVKKEEIAKQPVGNVISSLSGRVTGVQLTSLSGAPGANIIVQIRGRNSIANGTNPLYVLDGVPFPSTTLNNGLGGAGTTSSPLDNLNPSDIESIEILKDADATAIYGSRGANGVILITTKKGRPGKSTFSIRGYNGMGVVTRKLDLLSTNEYLSMRREAFRNDGATPTNVNAPDLLLWDTTKYTDWQNVLLGETMRISDLNLSYSGGNDQTQFLVSAGYHKETTIMPGDFGSEKVNGLFNLNHSSVNRKWSFSLTGSYLVNNNRLPREDISTRIILPPNTPDIYKTDGSLNWANSTWINPLSLLMRKFTNRTLSFNSNASISYNFNSNFIIKVNLGYSNLLLKEHATTPKLSFNPALNSISTASFGTNSVTTLIAEPHISYEHLYGLHRIEAIAGMTIQQTVQQGLLQTGSGYASDELLNSLRSASSVVINSETDTRYRYSGAFARVAYGFMKKYHATATLRRDGSSRFGPEDRFATFGSLALAYVFSSEKWFSSQRVISFGKLKASMGKTGNDQIGDYRYLDLYSPYSFSYQSVVPFYPTQLFNPSYGWEQVNKKEIGIDLGFVHDRFLLSLNYYHNQTTNQLISYPLPTTTGFSGILRNLPAVIRNNGIELEVDAKLIQRPSFKWTASVNITIPRNKLVSFDEIDQSSYANTYVIGQPLSIVKRLELLFVNDNTGLYTFRDFDSDGSISFPNDEQAIVNVGQLFFGGVQQNFVVGRFSFSFLFQFVRQPNASNYLTRFGLPGRLENQPSWVMERWSKPGDQTSIQRFAVTSGAANLAYTYLKFSDRALSDGSFIRLRNVHLTYDFNLSALQKVGLSHFQIFMQGQNLWTITKYKGLDPETQTFLPPVKLLTAGIHINL